MTDKTFDSGWLWAGALSFFLAGAVVAHFSNELILAYPLDTWRMDLDDLFGNIGTFLVGVAALIGLRRVRKRTEINGAEAARVAAEAERVAAQVEQREERDFQRLREEFDDLYKHFVEWDGKERRKQ